MAATGEADTGRIGRYLINRNYARLWSGQAVSTVGDFVFDTTLVLWVATDLGRGKSWAPAAVSGILLFAVASYVLVGPLAGVFVDRWDRKRTMLTTELIRFAVVGGLAALSFVPTHDIPIAGWLVVLYAVVFVVNSSDQFFSPARFAVLGQVVSGDTDRARAAGIGQATNASAGIIGPPLAAPLLFTAGLQWALIINAASFVFSYVVIRRIELTPVDEPAGSGRPNTRREFVAGLRLFAGSRYLIALVAVAIIAAAGAGSLNALDVFFVTDNLHVRASLYGFLGTAFGVGTIVGGLAASRIVTRLGPRTTAWLSLIIAGILVVGYSRQSIFGAGIVLTVAFAIPVAVLNASLPPMIFNAVPGAYLGRVLALFNPATQLSSMLSIVVAGWLASSALHNLHADVLGLHIGRIDTIFSAAGVFIILAGIYAFIALPHDTDRAPAAASGRRVSR